MRRLLLCFLLVAAAPAAAPAQESAPAQTEAAATLDQGTAAVGAEPGVQANGLPVAAPPPRTLRAYWHVFVAFAVAWALLFGYVIVLGRRFGSLEREITRLEGSGS